MVGSESDVQWRKYNFVVFNTPEKPYFVNKLEFLLL
jgi:hypothetical protein